MFVIIERPWRRNLDLTTSRSTSQYCPDPGAALENSCVNSQHSAWHSPRTFDLVPRVIRQTLSSRTPHTSNHNDFSSLHQPRLNKRLLPVLVPLPSVPSGFSKWFLTIPKAVRDQLTTGLIFLSREHLATSGDNFGCCRWKRGTTRF